MQNKNNSKTRNSSLSLMSSRLGVYNAPLPTPVEGDGIADETSLKGLSHQTNLLKYNGGTTQHSRMIKDKRRSLDRAIKYSYQSATIKKVDGSSVSWGNGFTVISGSDESDSIQALMNPNKLKFDYDDKILSVPNEHGFKTGDVFEWIGTNTKWLVTLQDMTELAYFRADVRRCSYKLEINEKTYYAAARGPVETKVNTVQKSGKVVDKPNHTIHLLLPKNSDTMSFFERYSKFYLYAINQPEDEFDKKVYWEVTAVDWISTPGILEVNAIESYKTEGADDILIGHLKAELATKEAPDSAGSQITIQGRTFIGPYERVEFEYKGIGGDPWVIEPANAPVKLETNKENPNVAYVTWEDGHSGQFKISNGKYSRTVVVESLF